MSIITLRESFFVVPSIAILMLYHLYLFTRVRKTPLTTSIGITNHARHKWVKRIREKGNEILAVQTFRNQLMAASFLASTAILMSLGAFSAAFRSGVFKEVSHALNLFGTRTEELWMFKLMLLGILFFFTFFNFTLAIRYYNHAGFMINTNEQDDPSVSTETVAHVVNHAALHYFYGMRGYYLSIPMALWLFGPFWMLASCLVLIIVLYRLDREA
jgi:uncharacterized membrane protein